MASNDPAMDDTPNSNSTQMEHVPAPTVPAHPAVTSTSLPHLGDFITKLIEDAYKVQSLSSELEQTKEKLREAENRIAELEIDNQTIHKDTNNVRELLSAAREDENAAKTKLQAQEDSVKCLEAALRDKNTALRDKDTALNGSIPKSRIANYKFKLGKIDRCDDEKTDAFWSILDHAEEIYHEPRVNEQVKKFSELVDDTTSRFSALYDAFESDLAEASISSA
ncbi:hypothetical protein B0H65DRAFT_571123 [Neurospora tetraspora]|uniref:Uncharacterized protein n=1 Tax=Neurospora tetraspora TaxID=94610 RepID=A0AAE0MTG6_9PEZI|nr:hypothetical protein B0H65DRAFT_571123 [Neurospora tetraspora]